jgi:uncharacterized protein YacL
VIRIIRIVGAALGALVGLALVSVTSLAGQSYGGALVAAWVVAWTVLGFAVLPYLTVVPAGWLVEEVQRLSTTEFVFAIGGLLIGLLMGLLLGVPLSALPPPEGTWLPLGVSITLGFGMMGLVLAKREDLVSAAEAAGLVRRPAPEEERSTAGPRIVVDTSAIIDGRVADITDAGFLYGRLVVSRVVLDEIQRIADSSDTLRRNRGRRGLEILARLQKDERATVEIVDDANPSIAEVDQKLVALASSMDRLILTNDFNLNRVAELQGVRVLNVNGLANAVKPALLPGEVLHVRVIQEGKEVGQGVGFLDDGTMIVVEGGARLIDRDVDVTVTRVLQTVAGRMIFSQPRAD